MPDLQRERLESLKVGSVGAIAFASAFGLTAPLHNLLTQQGWLTPALVLTPVWDGPHLFSLGNALLAGFLFGVTYRYIIRQDQNLHLNSGAVLAFGLVRGLAQVDVGLGVQASALELVVVAAENIVLFAATRLLLDWAIARGLVKPFGA